MAQNGWVNLVGPARTAGGALTNSTTATSLLPAGDKFYLNNNIFQIGTKHRFKAAGKISTAAAAPGTLKFQILFGATVVFDGGVSGTLATSATNLTWDLEINTVCQAVGAGTSTTLVGTGKLLTAALSATTPIQLLPASAPGAGSGFDATSAQQVDLFAQWSAASASNSIQLLDWSIEQLN